MAPLRCLASLSVAHASSSAPLRPACRRQQRTRCRSKQDDSLVNEDVLAKLRAFEEENKKLKERLAGKARAHRSLTLTVRRSGESAGRPEAELSVCIAFSA